MIVAHLHQGNGSKRVAWICPGCNDVHQIDPARWTWNGSLEKPTFSPSVLVTWTDWVEPERGGPKVCHSFVVEGQMQFLGDCTHALAGKTVPIGEWNKKW